MIKLSVGAVTFYNPTDEVVNMKKYVLSHTAMEQKNEVMVFYIAFTHRSLWIELAGWLAHKYLTQSFLYRHLTII